MSPTEWAFLGATALWNAILLYTATPQGAVFDRRLCCAVCPIACVLYLALGQLALGGGAALPGLPGRDLSSFRLPKLGLQADHVGLPLKLPLLDKLRSVAGREDIEEYRVSRGSGRRDRRRGSYTANVRASSER